MSLFMLFNKYYTVNTHKDVIYLFIFQTYELEIL